MAKKKYYVVWQGREPGIYESWVDCQAQVTGVSKPQYKSFDNRQLAEEAFSKSAEEYIDYTGKKGKKKELQNPPSYRHDTVLPLPPEVIADAWAVDAACSGNPGPMEYQCVDLQTGAIVFHFGPIRGTNNIGEFLAIVHAVALLTQKGIKKTIYSDSRNALLWFRQRKCKTQLKATPQTAEVLNLVDRAEKWLQSHTYNNISVLKWDTKRWGEIPADFGRK